MFQGRQGGTVKIWLLPWLDFLLVSNQRLSAYSAWLSSRCIDTQLVPCSKVKLLLPLQGTYLLLEKLRYAVFRRLLRKLHAVRGELEPEKRAQIPLAQFQAALAMQVCAHASSCVYLECFCQSACRCVGCAFFEERMPHAHRR